MTSIIEIKGTIQTDDGKVSEFVITSDLGWQQWGERQEVLGDRVDALDSITKALDAHMEDEEAYI